jgi:uncharacterized RDD family membrane protein YckC
MKYAGVWIRGFAQALDYIFLSLFFFPVTYIVKGTWLMFPEDHLWIIFDPLCAIFLIVIFAYFIFSEGLTGVTIGKLILGLKVLNISGDKITLHQSVIRNLGRLLDGLPMLNILGIISIARSPIKQRIGDKLAKTTVEYRRKITTL